VWSIGDGGDPAELLTAFLLEDGLPVRELGRTATDFHPVGPGTVCGAVLYVSAAAASVMAGGPRGPASPVPSIPDIFARVYLHGNGAERFDSAATDLRIGPWRASWTPAEHAAAVAEARAAIGRGDVYQVNVVGHAAAAYSGDIGPALARVATLPGARYGGVLTSDGWPTGGGRPTGDGRAIGDGRATGDGRPAGNSRPTGGRLLAGEGAFSGAGRPSDGRPAGGEWAIACASPETLVEVRAGRVITRPIKGTRPATAAGHAELLASAKERAEHVMIVDLARNDLSRLSGAGPVTVDELFAVRRWCALWQAESVVSAPVTGPLDLADLLRALAPGGSVTGAPKLAALHEIARLEPVGRGASMGALGWVGTGHVDLGLTIRTVAASAGEVHLWAGGGITWGSDPAAEVAEAAAKADPIRRALRGRS